MVVLEHIPFDADAGIAARARIGLVSLASDHTIESELHQLIDGFPGVALFSNRIENVDHITPDTLRAMAPRITSAVASILPGTPLDVVAYGCTSASIAIGEDRVFDFIKAAQPEAACTTPITAGFAALTAFGARRVAVLTPYRSDVNQLVAAAITARGFEVPAFASFNEPSDAKVAAISPASIRAGIEAVLAAAGGADAVFVSCTSLRLCAEVATIEADLGVPVTSSNHAMAWHALRLAGVTHASPSLGHLFTLPQ